ncbi:MAG: cupredoxin domain-containing protein [Ardenticatenaceae bacterium]|nr:cupredoxin domain-containing protein [Ardenticatenaceae bacterium]
MQATTVSEKTNHLLTQLGIGLGILLAVGLFVVAIGRMGLLNGLLGREITQPGAIHLTAQDMRFGQTEIHLKVGQTVTLTLDNKDFFGHSFDANDFDVHTVMPANSQVTASFTATRPGVFDFYCGVPGHQKAGMVGKFIVEP